MDLLLILTYTAICVAVFKFFKIPLTKWTVPTAVLGGIALIGTLIFVMNYNHPYSEVARVYYTTTPIVPSVSGRVISVDAQPNSLMSEGDVIFQIDKAPFQSSVDSVSARLQSAQQDLKRQEELDRKKLGTKRDLDNARAMVKDLEGQLAKAEFDLEQTTVRAPGEGFVTQLALRPGMYAASLPLRPVVVFIHRENAHSVGWFRQNSLLRLMPGDEAEIAFDGIPGEVFEGRVKQRLPALAEGQVQANGMVLGVNLAEAPGRIAVEIEITDPDFAEYAGILPGGAYGQMAIYSEHAHHVAVMRKILLRMSAWMNYLFPFH